jgi:hypothetical protein
MSFRAIHRNMKCRTFGGCNLQISLPVDRKRSCSLQSQITSGPSRRTQEGSKDNAALRLDSSLETPTVNTPAVRSGSAHTSVA